MTSAYERAITLSKDGPGLRTGRIEDSWLQGRGIFGGVLAAATLSAMTEDVADASRIPRSLTLHFCAPAGGDFSLATEVVRAGSRVTHATARITNDGKVSTIATASFCRERPAAERYVRAVMPAVEPALSREEFPTTFPGLPVFFQHLDVRFCGPTMPFSKASEPNVAAWVRLREPASLDAPLVALLIDVLPAAITATFGSVRPIASVDLTINFFAPIAEAALGEHQLVAITSRWAGDGYTEEVRDLWSPRGELLAQCRQLIALL